MAQLHYNDPEYLKERQNSKPLTFKQAQTAIDLLNKFANKYNQPLLQKLIYEYENLRHFKAVNSNVEYEIVESKMNS